MTSKIAFIQSKGFRFLNFAVLIILIAFSNLIAPFSLLNPPDTFVFPFIILKTLSMKLFVLSEISLNMNNLSERALRGIKSKMKISGQFKNIANAEYCVTIRSYIETCYRNGVNGHIWQHICLLNQRSLMINSKLLVYFIDNNKLKLIYYSRK